MFKDNVRIFKQDKLSSIGVVLFSSWEPGRELRWKGEGVKNKI